MGITVKGRSLPMSDFVVITVEDIDRAIATSGRMRSFLNAKISGNKSRKKTL